MSEYRPSPVVRGRVLSPRLEVLGSDSCLSGLLWVRTGPYIFRWTESLKKVLKKGLKKVTELKKVLKKVMKLKKGLKKVNSLKKALKKVMNSKKNSKK